MKRISFIVPAFNAEETLSRCLDSILSQINQEDLEIIVINDGSTDSTLNIVMSYQLKHDNIKIIGIKDNAPDYLKIAFKNGQLNK